eukprot:3491300-Heterocapsa_arctica.AAC.1
MVLLSSAPQRPAVLERLVTGAITGCTSPAAKSTYSHTPPSVPRKLAHRLKTTLPSCSTRRQLLEAWQAAEA